MCRTTLTLAKIHYKKFETALLESFNDIKNIFPVVLNSAGNLLLIGGSEGGPRGAVPPLALPLPPLDSQYYIDTRNWNHAFTLYSEV